MGDFREWEIGIKMIGGTYIYTKLCSRKWNLLMIFNCYLRSIRLCILGDLRSTSYSSTNMISWNYPPPSNSQCQEYSSFSRKSQPKPSFVTVNLGVFVFPKWYILRGLWSNCFAQFTWIRDWDTGWKFHFLRLLKMFIERKKWWKMYLLSKFGYFRYQCWVSMGVLVVDICSCTVQRSFMMFFVGRVW